jgi:AraC-like DNA-binding protein
VRETVLEQRSRPPAPVLRHAIRRYVASEGAGLTPGTHRGVPSRYLTLIVGVGCPIDVAAMPPPAQVPRRFDALVGGLHTGPATIRYGTRIRCIRIELTPLGARAVLGLPAGAVAERVVALRDVLGRDGDELLDRLHAAGTWAARFAILDEVLARRVWVAGSVPAEVAWAWRSLLASGGTMRIGALAQRAGWGRRHLGERFRAELGLTPKAAARVLRFERSLGLLARRGSPGWRMWPRRAGTRTRPT